MKIIESLWLIFGVLLDVFSSQRIVFPDMVNEVVDDQRMIKDGNIKNISIYKQKQLQDRSAFPFDMTRFWDESFCANGTDYCTEPIKYPTTAIRKALKKQKKIIKTMFDPPIKPRSGLNIFNSGNSENVCASSTTHIRPKAARNKKGQFKFLVNVDKGADEYIQLVKITQCLGAGEACGNGRLFTSEPTKCKQEYTDHKMVALDDDGRELVVDTFSFPSCCSCYMQTGLEL